MNKFLLMSKALLYSFVIPAYNEEDNIPLLYKQIISLDFGADSDIEIIFVNDGSIDNTKNVVKSLAVEDQRVKLVDLSRNFGHQAALSAGLKYACGDAVISMDCDLQDPPQTALEMIEKWKTGANIVYAKRKNFRKDNILKRVGSKLFYRVMGRFSNIEIPNNVGDFRLVDKNVLKILNKMNEHSRYLRGMVAWTGFKHDFVEYERPDRDKGISGYNLSKLANLGIDGMFNFSVFPLRLGSILGVVSMLSGFCLFTYQLIDVLVNGVYYHLYKWLIVILFIFMGFMFLLMWIIGEYIGKIYDDARNRPLYIIKDTVNFNKTIVERHEN